MVATNPINITIATFPSWLTAVVAVVVLAKLTKFLASLKTAMGKKAKTKRGEMRAQGRKPDPKSLPPPAPPIEDEVGCPAVQTTVASWHAGCR